MLGRTTRLISFMQSLLHSSRAAFSKALRHRELRSTTSNGNSRWPLASANQHEIDVNAAMRKTRLKRSAARASRGDESARVALECADRMPTGSPNGARRRHASLFDLQRAHIGLAAAHLAQLFRTLGHGELRSKTFGVANETHRARACRTRQRVPRKYHAEYASTPQMFETETACRGNDGQLQRSAFCEEEIASSA